MHANYLEGYYSADCWALPPDSLIQWVWDGVQEPEYLTSSQGMLTLLVPGHLLRTTGLTDLRQGGSASACLICQMDSAQGAMCHLGLCEHRTAQVPCLTGGHLLKDGDFTNEFFVPPRPPPKKHKTKQKPTTPNSLCCFSEGIRQ